MKLRKGVCANSKQRNYGIDLGIQPGFKTLLSLSIGIHYWTLEFGEGFSYFNFDDGLR